MKDIIGQALLDYQNGNYTDDIHSETNISEEDILPLPYLFRSFSEMPPLEQLALNTATGKVLDVGCGSGSISLHLQENGLEVTSIDTSGGAIEVCNLRGLKNAREIDILQLKNEKFDTILLLMNGTGIFQKIKEVSKYLLHLKSLLNSGGQILIDSSDINYMYEDEDGGVWYNANNAYYGELDYFLSYKGEREISMKWLYLDFNTLLTACTSVGINCELILEGEHFDYLARLS